MPQQKVLKKIGLIGHILFWMASILLMLFFFYFNEKKVHFDFDILVKAIIPNAGFALGVYVNLYFLIPRYLKQRNYIFYIFGLVVLLTVSSLTIQALLIFPLRKLLSLGESFNSFNTNLHAAYFFATLIYVALTSFLKFVKDWLAMQDLNLKLAKIERQKLEAELKTLKGQLNPHFLFNSLNNIYSLALVKSDKVPELILKLSDLMRHIIYESKEKYISLRKELDFVTNFVALQQIRTPEHVKIGYHFLGEIPDSQIAPLLFEPFIDKAIKHGLPNSSASDFIKITFDFTVPNHLLFTIANNYEDTDHWNKRDSGIGIQNVKKRLRLLYHKNEYELEINKSNHVFLVSLKLKLK